MADRPNTGAVDRSDDPGTGSENNDTALETHSTSVSDPVRRVAVQAREGGRDAPHGDDVVVAGLNGGDRLFLLGVGTVVLLLMLVHWVRLSGWGRTPVEITHHDPIRMNHQIDVNRATALEWMQLEGVGELRSWQIVEDRERNGPFRSVDELARVDGIGPKTVERLRPWLTVESVDHARNE